MRSWVKEQEFKPSFLGFVVNPFYFVRRGLLVSIAKHSEKLQGRMIDLGCGSKPYRSLFNVAEYIGVDVENPGHSHQNEQIDVYYDGKTLPFPDGHFDSAFSSEVIEHITYLDQVTSELKRVLKPGGKLLLTCPFVWSEHELPHDYRRFTSIGLAGFLKSRGFKVHYIEKSTTDCETVFQNLAMLIAVATGNHKYLKWLVRLALIAPLNLLGIVCSLLLPNKGIFYSNTIILAEKQITDHA